MCRFETIFCKNVRVFAASSLQFRDEEKLGNRRGVLQPPPPSPHRPFSPSFLARLLHSFSISSFVRATRGKREKIETATGRARTEGEHLSKAPTGKKHCPENNETVSELFLRQTKVCQVYRRSYLGSFPPFSTTRYLLPLETIPSFSPILLLLLAPASRRPFCLETNLPPILEISISDRLIAGVADRKTRVARNVATTNCRKIENCQPCFSARKCLLEIRRKLVCVIPRDFIRNLTNKSYLFLSFFLFCFFALKKKKICSQHGNPDFSNRKQTARAVPYRHIRAFAAFNFVSFGIAGGRVHRLAKPSATVLFKDRVQAPVVSTITINVKYTRVPFTTRPPHPPLFHRPFHPRPLIQPI